MARRIATALIAATLSAAALSAAAGKAAAQPNLAPLLNAPMNASVAVQNTGTTASGPSHLTINCTKFGKADGGCPDAPGMAAYIDPAFPNRVVIDVPALQPGESFGHDLSFWNSIAWTPGTYVFDAVADAGNAVAESDEGNNASQSSYTELPAVGVAPPSPLPLTAGAVPARPRTREHILLAVPAAPQPQPGPQPGPGQPKPDQKLRPSAGKQMLLLPAIQKQQVGPLRLAPAK